MNTKKIKQKLWNPVAFFVSFFMSLFMPVIFSLQAGQILVNCLITWPLRWIVAYALINFIVRPLSLKLAGIFFNFPPKPKKSN